MEVNDQERMELVEFIDGWFRDTEPAGEMEVYELRWMSDWMEVVHHIRHNEPIFCWAYGVPHEHEAVLNTLCEMNRILYNYEWDVQWWADYMESDFFVDWDSIAMCMYVKQMISLFRRYHHSYGGTFGNETKEVRDENRDLLQ